MKPNNNNKQFLLPSWGRSGGGLALKSLWARRKRNVWLFLELILVTILSWAVLDPVIISIYDKSLPLGYDKDRLCLVSLDVMDKKERSIEELNENLNGLKHLLRNEFPEIEQIANSSGYLPSTSIYATMTYYNDTIQSEETKVRLSRFESYQGNPIFSTFGVKLIAGDMTVEELDSGLWSNDGCLVSRSVADQYFGSPEDAIGKYLHQVDWHTNTIDPNLRRRIIGVVENIKVKHFCRNRNFVIECADYHKWEGGKLSLIVRLKEEESAEKFSDKIGSCIRDGYGSGCLELTRVQTMSDLNDEREATFGYTEVVLTYTCLAVLFLVNLCLGVIGTFWLQTKQRRGEVGIMRSFGATRGGIVRLILSESALLTTSATIIGCLIYLQYALKQGLYLGIWGGNIDEGTTWVSDFSLHFIITSVIVYCVMLFTVLIGAYIPARNLSRIPPVDALKEK